MAPNLKHPDEFTRRHIGPDADDVREMLAAVGATSLDDFIDQTVPRQIRYGKPLDIPPAVSEHELLMELDAIAQMNQVFRSFIGMGYSDCITPPVILRNILQNPGWYTAYTPYQAEISQGRLEALLNYQTMIIEMTGLEVANASLLDEGTAAAEAMTMLFGIKDHDRSLAFFVSNTCHPQTIEVLRTRAEPLGIEIILGDHQTFDWSRKLFGAIVQYPATDGAIYDYRLFCERAHAAGALVVAAADLLSLALLAPPGAWGADVAVGNTQRFGVPLGYGGPHAAYFATRNEFVRKMPGRLIGVSKDAHGNPALRMALQTREQHIRREKATSNICTAQVLLAVVAGMYAVYHGPRGVRAIAERVHKQAAALASGLKRQAVKLRYENFFDTVCVDGSAKQVDDWLSQADVRRMNFRRIGETTLSISLDETSSSTDVEDILAIFARDQHLHFPGGDGNGPSSIPSGLRRTSSYLTHPVFNRYHSETEMLRYLKSLENRDFSLVHGMIPLGSCTMKLNATTEMVPITWPQFNRLHPFAPPSQAGGYRIIFEQLENWLAEITGLPGVSLQPNAGSQGEYAGLLVIRRYHHGRGQGDRDICLIPASAHGTNPASAVMAGYKVVVVACDENGNIDLADLETKACEHCDNLAALMVTYPSTYGVFEEEIERVCSIIHQYGGQVYLDGANMNAQVGLCRPGDFGADVCHLNLHKTFCVPHGGGGPGMGPIAVAAHLVQFLPRHPLEYGGLTPLSMGCGDSEPAHRENQSGVKPPHSEAVGPVSAAPWGSASILLISWSYIKLMGGNGLTQATKVAILNANYVAQKLSDLYSILFRGRNGRVAHECILDTRPLKKSAGIEVEDVAKRLMDYGFHAPTVSFPVPGTMMIEPTESESKAELDRFCEAMIAIRSEIREIEEGKQPRDNNLLKNAPHTADAVVATQWLRPYSRERAAFPTAATRHAKFWPAVGRIDNAYGDRNLICACPPVSDYADSK